MVKISVIVAVYKVEQYLQECLLSLANQSFKEFELILVDDGSPDKSGVMCDEFAKKHDNVIVIHQENMGLSEARNQGVKHAKGEYITFIDSDDYVSSDYLEYLHLLIEKYQADIAIANNVKFDDLNAPVINVEKIKDYCVSPSVALENICYGIFGIYAWAKLYKKELVEKYPYPKGALYEDLATTYKLVGGSTKVAYGEKPIYFWRQRTGSITHQEITKRHLYGVQAGKELVEYMRNNYPEVVPAAQNRCVTKMIDLAYRIVMGNKNKELFNCIRQEVIPLVKHILNNSKVSISVKVRTCCLAMGYYPFMLISKVYSCIK